MKDNTAPLRLRHKASLKVGQSKGKARVWIEGKYLADAGFAPGSRFEVLEDGDIIRLRLSSDPRSGRIVSTRKSRPYPIIDYLLPERCSLAKSASLSVSVYSHSIVIEKERIARKVSERVASLNSVSLFAGGGLLTEAARCAGFSCVAANEIDPGYAEIFRENHPEATVINSSIEQVDFEEILEANGPIGLLDLGLPCEPFSNARRGCKGKNLEHPESHENGDLAFWALMAIDKLNPYTVVIEEVPGFLQSASFAILERSLSRMGYQVDARVFDASDYSMATSRRRAVVVATTKCQINWPEPTGALHLFELLNKPDHPDNEWFDRQSKPWLYSHWEKQTAKGNGFAPPIITEETSQVGTIKKRYFAQQGDNPVVGHPNKGKHRWLTIDEVKRITGLDSDYYLGESKTRAGEIMGQGVPVHLFTRIVEAVCFGKTNDGSKQAAEPAPPFPRANEQTVFEFLS